MMSDGTPRPRGRPRDPETAEGILTATRAALLEHGYHRLSIEGVASAAGASKATIYRWWDTKGALVLDAAAEQIAIGVVPDTGDTRQDLLGAAEQLITTFSDPLAGAVIFAAVGNLDDDPNMAMTFRERAVFPWRQSAAEAIQRGIERGDLHAETDVQLLLDVMVGTVFQRTLVMQEPMTEGLAAALVDLVLAAD